MVIAHTHAPEWLTVVRSFDVPLMVFISAISYTLGRTTPYLLYVKKRFIRIYKPVFFFLCLFFLASGIMSIFIQKLSFGADKIIGSFLLLNKPSIGYVWIMRVFLIAAFLMPVISKYLITRNVVINSAIIIILYVASSLSIELIPLISNDLVRFIYQEFVVYMVGYSMIIYVGMINVTDNISHQYIYVGIILLLFLYVCFSQENLSLNPADYKYPPRGIYILYGCLVSSLLWFFRRFINISSIPLVIEYTSKNSMWLYLWHILPVYTLGYVGILDDYWITRYIYVVCIMYLLNYLFDRICTKFPIIDRLLK